MALVEYFFKPWSGNGHKPFVYDYEHFRVDDNEDFSIQFVSKVMRTHKGQCRSLPYYYKILAEAIGAEAYITYAPIHTFIKYPDAEHQFPGDYVNVELTTHGYAPDSHYIEKYEINEKSIESKVYMNPISDKETVASQLSDLAFAYTVKFGAHDDFTLKCASKSLEYYPQNYNTMIIFGKSSDAAMYRHIRSNGGKVDEYLISLDRRSAELQKQIIAWGWEPLDDAYYKRLDERNLEAAKILKETGGTVIIGD